MLNVANCSVKSVWTSWVRTSHVPIAGSRRKKPQIFEVYIKVAIDPAGNRFSSILPIGFHQGDRCVYPRKPKVNFPYKTKILNEILDT